MLKVSIIIPVYNVAPYIVRCLNSVYNQTYTNFEVVIVDDCSTDNSMNLIHSFLSSEKSAITTIKQHSHNRGISAARNTGINIATGEYIFFIDSDDYITPNCIETFTKLASKYNYPTAIFGSAELFPTKWNDKSSCISANKPEIPEFSNSIRWIRKAFLKSNFLPVTAWNKLIKREYIIHHNLFFKEGIIHEDIPWGWIIGNNLSSIAFNKENTYYYCYSPNSITNMEYGKKNSISEIIIIKELFKNINYLHFIPQFIYILHFSHSCYCKRQGNKSLEPNYIRYPKAFIFFLKCLYMNPEKLYFANH